MHRQVAPAGCYTASVLCWHHEMAHQSAATDLPCLFLCHLQHAAETHPDIKRLRLSSSEPETVRRSVCRGIVFLFRCCGLAAAVRVLVRAVSLTPHSWPDCCMHITTSTQEEAINNNQEQQCSMMSTEPAPAQDHPLNLQHQQHHSAAAAANYAAMNALLKQLHLERLQRMQQAPDGGYYHRQGHPAGGS